MYQRWQQLTFLHWPYDYSAVRALVPSSLEVDTFAGAAWIGLVPFVVADLRPPGMPALPWLGRFPETNVRTYVRGRDGRPGVYFFTLDADRLAAVLAARLLYRLPYRWADMSVRSESDRVTYRSARRGAYTTIEVENGELTRAGELEKFLTARFSLFTTLGNYALRADVEHVAWPLRSATLHRLDQNLLEACGLPSPSGKPLVHFSEDIAVRIGRIRSANTTPGSR